MKKYKFLYVVIYGIVITLVITKGIKFGIITNEVNDYGVADMFVGSDTFLVYNFIIMLSLFSISLIATKSKNNEIKHKNLIFFGIVILLLFIPIYCTTRTGGIAGLINQKEYFGLAFPIIRLFR